MKILYMSWFSSGEGSKIHAQEFTRAMKNLGHTVINRDLSIRRGSLSAGSPNSPAVNSNMLKNFLREFKSIIMAILRFIRLIGYMIKNKPDLIIYRYTIYDLSGIFVGKLFRIPVIYEVNGSVEYEREISGRYYFKRLVRSNEKYIFEHADLVLLVSNELKSYFEKKNYNIENTLIVPNGVDIERFSQNIPLPKDLQKIKDDLSDKKVIGFTGSLKSWHGAERIIDILPEIIKVVPDARYLIIGDGERRGVIEDKIKKLGLENHVYITGFQDHSLIPTLIDIMDIAVAPYHDIDFFHFSPLKVFEYMAKGKPVVAPALGQCVDLVGKDNGILIQENNNEELKNAILRLLEDTDLAKRLGNNARKFIEENYTWEQNARKIENAIINKKKVRGEA